MGERLEADVGDDLRLLGYDHPPSAEGLHLAFFWQAMEAMDTDYAISVRPTKAGELLFHDGQLVQQDHAHPVWGYYPTSTWRQDEVVRDDYLISIPAGMRYDGVTVIVYRMTEEGFQDLGAVSFPIAQSQGS